MPSLMEGWSEARRIAQPFVMSLAHRDISGAEALRTLQGAGIGYREGDFYEDWRRELGLVRHQAQLERLRPGSQPPAGWMTDRPWDGLTTSLVYEFHFTGRYSKTMDEFDRYVGVGSDTRLTVGEATQLFIDGYLEPKVCGDLENVSLSLVSVWHKTDSEYLQ